MSCTRIKIYDGDGGDGSDGDGGDGDGDGGGVYGEYDVFIFILFTYFRRTYEYALEIAHGLLFADLVV